MKQKTVSADTYVFESARIRALENRLIGGAALERLMEAGSLSRCLESLEELGVEMIREDESGEVDRERTLERRLQEAYREVLSLTDRADFLRLWLYPYDCNNVKAIIKCRYRGVSAEGALFDFGSIPHALLQEIADHGAYEKLPSPFDAAAAEAAKALAATANPQTVDLILDRACYGGMLELARGCGVEFALELVMQRIDLTNLMICLRRLRGADRYVREILPREMFLEGGKLSYEYLNDLCLGGEAYFWRRLEFSVYDKFAYRGGASVSLGRAEQVAEDLFMEQVRRARSIPYGAEPLLGYLLGCEYEVKNLRILLSGYAIAPSGGSVWERIRSSYV